MRLLIFVFLCFSSLSSAYSQMYSTLDSRAKSAPHFKSEVELVDYLTKNIQDDKAKARVIAAWMVYQVERDGYRRKELLKYSNSGRPASKPLENNTFQTRIGTSQDFANLYAILGRLAGLEVEIINGYAGEGISAFRYKEPKGQALQVMMDSVFGAKNYQLQRYQSSWNAVKINDKWNLVDTYWMIANEDLYAARDIQSDRAMEMFLERRARNTPNRMTLASGKTIDGKYFFGTPQYFIDTHFPLDPKWQLLPVPYTWSSFISR